MTAKTTHDKRLQQVCRGSIMLAALGLAACSGYATGRDAPPLEYGPDCVADVDAATPWTDTPTAHDGGTGIGSEESALSRLRGDHDGRPSARRIGSAAIPPALLVALADIAPGGPRVKELQSMLLRATNLEATTATFGVDFFAKASGGSGPELPITSYIASDVGASPFPAVVGQSFISITGFGYHAGSSEVTAVPKLAPRSASDVQ